MGNRFARAVTLTTLTALLAAASITMTPAVASAEQPAQEILDTVRYEELQIVNAERARHGLSPLRLEASLIEAAQRHANDMTDRRYVSHTSPEGTTPADRWQAVGGSPYRKVAENLYGCDCLGPINNPDLEMMHVGWMGSPGHRQNILDPELTSFGFGVSITDDGYQIAVQTFAGDMVQSASAW